MNQAGVVTSTENAPVTGSGAFEASNAGRAFVALTGGASNITGTLAVGTRGRDGQRWRAVPRRTFDVSHRIRGPLAGERGGTVVGGRFAISAATLRNDDFERIGFLTRGLRRRPVAARLSNAPETLSMTVPARQWWWPTRWPGLDSRVQGLPEGMTTLLEFAGGTVEFLDEGGAPVLRGAIPESSSPLGPCRRGVQSSLRAPAALSAAGPGTGAVEVEARVENRPSGARERVHIRVTGLDRSRAPFRVVAVTADGELPLGSLGRRRLLTLANFRRGARPALAAPLSGATIEVRAADGSPVLRGTLPAFE